MINPFKLKKLLKQTHTYVATINRLNDELSAIAKQQNEIIAQQQQEIERLTQHIRRS